jgi:hypothetical protein
MTVGDLFGLGSNGAADVDTQCFQPTLGSRRE